MATKLEVILKSISRETIDKKIAIKYKYAEMLFRPPYPVPKSLKELYLNCASFLIHMYKVRLKTNYPVRRAMEEAHKMINKIYSKEGGFRYALLISQRETFAPIKAAMTKEFISEDVGNYVGLILRGAINPYNYKEIKELMLEYVRRFNIRCTEGDLNVMISNYESIIRSHVRWSDEMELDRQARALSA